VSERREPVSLEEALRAVSSDLGMPAPDVFEELVGVWSDLVGPALAAHAHVRSLRDGECTIVVDGPVWATQLRYLGDDLIARANAACGGDLVRVIRVVVGA
jgi:predicted nucleic acid-binding Zn ribbon protein